MLQRATAKRDYSVEESPQPEAISESTKKKKRRLRMVAPAHEYTVEEYLQFEETSRDKHEFYRGEIYLMAGGTYKHNIVAGNVIGELRNALIRKNKECDVSGSDMRIAIPQEEFYSYGDAVIVCGEPEFVLERQDLIKNPTLIVEVLSPSTRKHDRTTKFELYKRLESFQHYFLVEPERIHIEYRWKTEDGNWAKREITDINDSISIAGMDIEVAVAELYRRIKF
jgi:Uma2 family endonuclease